MADRSKLAAGLAAGTGRNASLACVRSRADNEFVARDLGASKEPTWIGLTQRMDANGEALATRDGWDQWASGCEDKVPTGAYRYTNWAAGEPNDEPDDEDEKSEWNVDPETLRAGSRARGGALCGARSALATLVCVRRDG